MNEGGANEPTPIVHNGVMFLANTGNIVQALDASTGDLIWENRIGPELSGRPGAIRSLALYEDKVYLATTDVRLVALDARTGKLVWETRIADTAKGYSNTSGPIVVNGKVIQGMGGCDRYKEDGCYHQRLRRRDRQAALEVRNRRARRRARRRHLGQSCPICCAPAATPGSPAATIPTQFDLLGRGASQALDARDSRHQRRGALHFVPPWRLIPTMANSLGTSSMCPANRSIWTGLRTRAGRLRRPESTVHHRQGRHPLETRPQDRQIPGRYK